MVHTHNSGDVTFRALTEGLESVWNFTVGKWVMGSHRFGFKGLTVPHFLYLLSCHFHGTPEVPMPPASGC